MDFKYEHLTSPITIGKTTFKNRMFVPAMGTAYAETKGPFGEFSKEGIEYITERARGGFGAMIIGVLFPDYEIDPCDPSQHPMLHKAEFMASAMDAIDQAGAFDMKLIQQLSPGCGRNYPGLFSCSENEVFGFPEMMSPALTHDQVKRKIEMTVEAAGLMKACGFAGVELNGHWGYLLDQFALALTNHRTDEYGGSLENRLRFAREIIEGIKQTCGSDFLVSMRMGLKSYAKGLNRSSFTGEDEAGRTLEEGLKIAQYMEQFGCDMLNVDVGIYDCFYYAAPPQYVPYGFVVPMAEKAKELLNIPVICGAKMNDPDLAEKAIADGKIDAVVLGRASLADPYFAKKVEMGKPEDIRPCIGCQVGCLWRPLVGGHTSCAVNPELFKETDYAPTKTLEPKTVAVVGGGIGGMEVARVASKRGHKVTIYEKSGELGGMNIPASAHDFKVELGALREWYKREMVKLGVNVEYNCEMDAEKLRALKPDVAVIAVGSAPVMPSSIPGIDSAKCCSCVEALNGKVEIGDTVVVVGGGLTGCEVAIDYAKSGKKVTLVEAADRVLAASNMVPITYSMMVNDMLEYYKVNVVCGRKIEAVNDDGVVISPTAGGESEVLPCDNVVMSIGLKPVPTFTNELRGSGIMVYEVGDCRAVGNHYTVIHNAYQVAKSI